MYIIGLGNKGDEYKYTRHNVGRLFVKYIYEQINGSNTAGFAYNKYTNSFEYKNIYSNTEIHLFQPEVYMNNSGDVVSKIINYNKVKISELTIVHDDLDIKFGSYLIQEGKGPHSHNGINSIEERVGKDFVRIRIGIENRQDRKLFDGKDYVLSKFSLEERKLLNGIFSDIWINLLKKT